MSKRQSESEGPQGLRGVNPCHPNMLCLRQPISPADWHKIVPELVAGCALGGKDGVSCQVQTLDPAATTNKQVPSAATVVKAPTETAGVVLLISSRGEYALPSTPHSLSLDSSSEVQELPRKCGPQLLGPPPPPPASGDSGFCQPFPPLPSPLPLKVQGGAPRSGPGACLKVGAKRTRIIFG